MLKNKLSKLTIALGLGFTFTLGLTDSVLAQYQTTPNDEGYQSGEKDSLYGDGITGINPLDLIHRANLSNGRTASEFSEESRSRIENSATDFKLLQQQQLLERYNNQNQSPSNNGE